ncbi:MAG: N-acetylmuramoyl-L-alanine amidase [Patescibacteria group bacterium]
MRGILWKTFVGLFVWLGGKLPGWKKSARQQYRRHGGVIRGLGYAAIGLVLLSLASHYFGDDHKQMTKKSHKPGRVATRPDHPTKPEWQTSTPKKPNRTWRERGLTTAQLRQIYRHPRVQQGPHGPELVGQTKPHPNPWKPTSRGLLSGLIVVVDPGHGGVDPGSSFEHAGAGFWESAYTYRAAYELMQLLRAKGATVHLTCWSDVMTLPEPPRAAVPMPLPRDARTIREGLAVRLSTRVLNARIDYADDLAKRYGGKRVLFVSLHTDWERQGLSGAFVCINPGEPAPLLATCIAAELERKNYRRRDNGKPRSCVVPQAKKYVLFAGKTPQRVIVEMATTTAPADGFRIRWERNRMDLLKTILAGIESYAAETW